MTSPDVDWIYPRLRNPSLIWKIFAYITIWVVVIFCKIVVTVLNKPKTQNQHILHDAIGRRKAGVPLITISNHHSCFDEPGTWGLFDLRLVCSLKRARWPLTAHDICFTNLFLCWFFMFGKAIPVIRGAGVYQKAVDLCIEKLSHGDWVHVFPEGKVNETKEAMRFKWGVGRMIYESPVLPIVIPIWHIGMDEVLPNVEPYRLKFGKKITFNFGQPIDLKETVDKLKEANVSDEEARRVITDRLQEVMFNLRKETEELHATYIKS